MVGKVLLAALAASACVCAASADETKEEMNLAMMHWIRDTVCASGETILFIPVSNDVPTLERTYAMVPEGHLDTISAHVVTPQERAWLSTHGCKTPDTRQQVVADLRSGGLDF